MARIIDTTKIFDTKLKTYLNYSQIETSIDALTEEQRKVLISIADKESGTLGSVPVMVTLVGSRGEGGFVNNHSDYDLIVVHDAADGNRSISSDFKNIARTAKTTIFINNTERKVELKLYTVSGFIGRLLRYEMDVVKAVQEGILLYSKAVPSYLGIANNFNEMCRYLLDTTVFNHNGQTTTMHYNYMCRQLRAAKNEIVYAKEWLAKTSATDTVAYNSIIDNFKLSISARRFLLSGFTYLTKIMDVTQEAYYNRLLEIVEYHHNALMFYSELRYIYKTIMNNQYLHDGSIFDELLSEMLNDNEYARRYYDKMRLTVAITEEDRANSRTFFNNFVKPAIEIDAIGLSATVDKMKDINTFIEEYHLSLGMIDIGNEGELTPSFIKHIDTHVLSH